MNYRNRREQSIPLQYGIVTFLDILGWQGIWRREPNPILKLEMIIDYLNNTIRRNCYTHTHVIVISDSILIYSDLNIDVSVDKQDMFRKLAEHKTKVIEILLAHSDLCSHIIPLSISGHIPIRGATSIGEYSVYKNTFVGSAIDEVASWYETADWVGVFMTPSLGYLLEELDFKNNENNKWVTYTPPLKNHAIRFSTLCVNWIDNLEAYYDSKGEFGHIDSLKAFFWDQNFGIFPPEITLKIQNTLDFAEIMEKSKE